MKHVGTARVRKPAGAQAALWAYAFVALLALFPPAMTDDMLPIALVYSLIGLYVAGLFGVDLLGKLDHGVLRSWIAVTAIVAVIISATVAAIPGLEGMDEDQAYRAMDLLVDADVEGGAGKRAWHADPQVLTIPRPLDRPPKDVQDKQHGHGP